MPDKNRTFRTPINFSREAIEPEQNASVPEQVRDLQRDPNGPLAHARRAPELRDDAPLATTRARHGRNASLRGNFSVEANEEPKTPGAEPELH